jgi:anti-sigma factor RsiW
MTRCDFEIIVGPYHDRELDERRAAEMAKHILDCSSCAEHLASLRRMSGAMGQIPLDPLSGMERARLYRAVDQVPRRAMEYAILRMAGGLAALAASLLIVTSIWLMGSDGVSSGAQSGGSPIAIVLPSSGVSEQASSNLSHWMVRNLGGDLP